MPQNTLKRNGLEGIPMTPNKDSEERKIPEEMPYTLRKGLERMPLTLMKGLEAIP